MAAVSFRRSGGGRRHEARRCRPRCRSPGEAHAKTPVPSTLLVLTDPIEWFHRPAGFLHRLRMATQVNLVRRTVERTSTRHLSSRLLTAYVARTAMLRGMIMEVERNVTTQLLEAAYRSSYSAMVLSDSA